MKKFLFIFCLIAISIQVTQIIYFKRVFFTTQYDIQYWKDRYEHSQYQLPLSQRLIGDDGLFAYSGYRLAKGDDPFSINNDKPPVAKYLFGFSILLFDNALYAVVLLGIGVLILFYSIADYFLKDKIFALFATTVLFLEPLFFSQLWITGLDLAQLFFLLLNVYLIINYDKSKRLLIVFFSGLALGLFTEVKPPILLPIIFVLEAGFLLLNKFIRGYLIFLIGFILGIILPYVRFILLGNGIIEVLKVHKFMASIYLQSQLKVHIGAIWQAISLGQFPDIVTSKPILVSEWWILWPTLTFLGLIKAFSLLKSKNGQILEKGIAVFILITLLVFTFIPSYPRYLVLVIPFLYLFGIKFFQKFSMRFRLFLFFLIIIGGIIKSFLFLIPSPDSQLKGFYYNLSHLYFHDIYQENISNNGLKLTIDQFRRITNKALSGAGVREITVKELSRNIPSFGNAGEIKIRMAYKTQDLGPFYEEKKIILKKLKNEWKIVWDWDIVLDGFDPSYKTESELILGKRGNILNSNGLRLAEDVDGYLVSINPEKMDSATEQSMLQLLTSYGYRGDIGFRNGYLENVLPDSIAPILTFNQKITMKEKEVLLSYPGVTITPYRSRIFSGIDAKSIDNTFYNECCTRIYSSYNYHGVKGVEKEFDKILWGHSGGKILMTDKNGDIIKVVFEKEKKDGQDIVLK